MRGFVHRFARWIPEGVYHRALKAEVEVVEGDINELLWDLTLYRHAMQRVVDALWDLDRIPKKSQAHQLFYRYSEKLRFQSTRNEKHIQLRTSTSQSR